MFKGKDPPQSQQSKIRFNRRYFMRCIWLAVLMVTSSLVAYSDENNCREVSGGIVTNFLNESGTVNGTSFVNETLGTATGDLKGGLGVYVLSLQQGPNGTTIFHNHHHWVTDAGDTIFLADAYATAYPTSVPGLFAAIYPNGVNIMGGTERFAGATGNIASWGAVDQNTGQIVLRYQGTICFARPEH
jgi:hypothetical protein